MEQMLAAATSRLGRFRSARAAAIAEVRHGSVTTPGSARSVADVLIVGGVDSLLLPVFNVLDGCGWSVRYQVTEEAAVEWLREHHAYVVIVEVGRNWTDVVSRLRRLPGCGEIILAAPEELPTEGVLRAGAHTVLRMPVESYDLLWSLVTAHREAHNVVGSSEKFG